MQNPPPHIWGDTTAQNPFTYLPSTLCDDWLLPAIATCQDGTTYRQRRSEVAAILMLPTGADFPGDWENIADWVNTIDNTNTDDTKGKYLVGIGSFLPDSAVEVNLSGGRYIEQRERTYRLNMAVLNIDDGHSALCRKLQSGARRYSFWLLTVGDRLIGGPKGMKPVRANADFVLASGTDSREVWNITLTTTFLQYPEMTPQAIDFTGNGLSGGGGGGGDCNCDIQNLLGDLATYVDDAAAVTGGLSTGDWYVVDVGNDFLPPGIPRRVGG
jgi:hypothetical protein